ncbi:MAG: M50 family metallopeptidase [Nannocystaceae bacterium]|nr:M50 family metallopeptidase [bacterium]
MAASLDSWLHDRSRRRRAKKALWLSIGLTALLYVIPLGGFVAYPLMLFSTLVHELGHGLTALLMGGSFERMAIFSDGSGVATHGGLGSDAAVARALISAGGLVGPAIVAALAFAVARTGRLSRVALAVAAAFFAVMMALFIRNVFGLVFTGLVAAGLGWTAWRRSADTAQVVLVFLAIQMSLSVFSRSDYLFVSEAHTGAGVMPSDTAHMAAALGGTYWLWGLACGAFSVLVLGLGVWAFSRAIESR